MNREATAEKIAAQKFQSHPKYRAPKYRRLPLAVKPMHPDPKRDEEKSQIQAQ